MIAVAVFGAHPAHPTKLATVKSVKASSLLPEAILTAFLLFFGQDDSFRLAY
jgi:hypothetical protein